MTESPYRPGLPPVPWRMRARPIHRGYPVPWFVADVDGVPDFRIVDARKYRPAIERRLCWLCGRPLGAYLAFAIGPMCAVNRVNSEPPSHRECAQFAMQGCPFMTQQEKGYRTAGLPDGVSDPAGFPITRQPGAGCLWITKRFSLFEAPGGQGSLFALGDPVSVTWWSHGRAATRAEVLASIESGYPILLEMAEQEEPDAVRELEAARDRALALIPA